MRDLPSKVNVRTRMKTRRKKVQVKMDINMMDVERNVKTERVGRPSTWIELESGRG